MFAVMSTAQPNNIKFTTVVGMMCMDTLAAAYRTRQFSKTTALKRMSYGKSRRHSLRIPMPLPFNMPNVFCFSIFSSTIPLSDPPIHRSTMSSLAIFGNALIKTFLALTTRPTKLKIKCGQRLPLTASTAYTRVSHHAAFAISFHSALPSSTIRPPKPSNSSLRS